MLKVVWPFTLFHVVSCLPFYLFSCCLFVYEVQQIKMQSNSKFEQYWWIFRRRFRVSRTILICFDACFFNISSWKNWQILEANPFWKPQFLNPCRNCWTKIHKSWTRTGQLVVHFSLTIVSIVCWFGIQQWSVRLEWIKYILATYFRGGLMKQ